MSQHTNPLLLTYEKETDKSISVELTPRQIELLRKLVHAHVLFESVDYCLKDYIIQCGKFMKPKRKENITAMLNGSIPYLKQMDELLCDLREQIKQQEQK